MIVQKTQSLGLIMFTKLHAIIFQVGKTIAVIHNSLIQCVRVHKENPIKAI